MTRFNELTVALAASSERHVHWAIELIYWLVKKAHAAFCALRGVG